MTTSPDDRRDPPVDGDERATVAGYLDYHRATLSRKCAGLTGEQLKARPLPTTNLSLLGLVRHLAEVERSWFRRNAAGQDAPPIFFTEADPDRDIDPPADADPEADLAVWRAEIGTADAAVADLPLEHRLRTRRGTEVTLRWVYSHMLEEYARHNGHADLLRQAIDGAVGE